MASKNVNRYIAGTDLAATTCLNTGAAATGATTTVSYFSHANGLFSEVYFTGTNTGRFIPHLINDGDSTTGAYLPNGNADNAGITWTFGGSLLNSLAQGQNAFTVGTSPAFFMEVKVGIPDISDYDVFHIGFVEPAAAHVANINTDTAFVGAYDEKAMIGVSDTSGTLTTTTSLAGSDTATDLAATAWADDAVKTLKVLVSSAGAVTYTIDGSADASAVAFSFADATVVYPCIIACKAANAADTPPIINYVKYGLQ
jgi:hypothetical protein